MLLPNFLSVIFQRYTKYHIQVNIKLSRDGSSSSNEYIQLKQITIIKDDKPLQLNDNKCQCTNTPAICAYSTFSVCVNFLNEA